jgi:hypothetical protein
VQYSTDKLQSQETFGSLHVCIWSIVDSEIAFRLGWPMREGKLNSWINVQS